MKKQKLFALIFLSVAVLISVFKTKITGAIIGVTILNSLDLIALISFVFGLILTFYEARGERERINDFVKQYGAGKISAIETVIDINKIVPISSIKFKTGLQHTISGERDSYPIPLKEGKKAEELAILEYLVALRNHPELRRANELHLAKGLSTKHYSEKIKRLIEGIKGKYARDLQARLGIT